MNSNMYLNPVVQDNMAKLKRFGYEIMEPASGHLACGIIGIGRLPEPEEIVDRIELTVCCTNTLVGKKSLSLLVAHGNRLTPYGLLVIIPAAAWDLPGKSSCTGRSRCDSYCRIQ